MTKGASLQVGLVVLALAGLAALAVAAFAAREWLDGDGLRYGAGALLGGAAGVALYHASFGFTGAYRRLWRDRRGAGLRAQLVLVGLACLVTYPLIGWQADTGLTLHPVVMPMGLVSALGAFLFGIGMQLGGGCASGTLFTAGGGSTRMLVTLAAFVAGSVWATAHLPGFWFLIDDWTGIRDLPGISVIAAWGPVGGLAALAGLLGLLWLISVAVERRAHGTLETVAPTESWLHGRWSLTAGAVVLAGISIGCMLIFQRPWGITAGFALWGAKLLAAVGVPVETWPYWQGWRAEALGQSVLADATSVMNFGILLGAMAAAALAGRFAPLARPSARDLATAVAGGLLMGYGARLAFGCNIGAFLGGMVSGSLHGVWWLIFGFAGSVVGTGLRVRVGLDPPLATRLRPT